MPIIFPCATPGPSGPSMIQTPRSREIGRVRSAADFVLAGVDNVTRRQRCACGWREAERPISSPRTAAAQQCMLAE
jgi:hypothetical protein